MRVRKTRAGWVVEITNMKLGCLEEGGISGREVLYTRATLTRVGINYAWDPEGFNLCEASTNVAYLLECIEPDRVLKAGHTIQ